MIIERRRMNLALAKTILNEAVSGGYLDEVPEDEEEILEQAEYFAKTAEKEYNSGWGKDNDTIRAIVELSKTSEEADKSIPDETAQEDQGSGSASSAFVREMSETVEMPFNVADLSDYDVRKYHGIFNSYYGRARHELAEEEASLVAAKHLRDNAFRVALSNASQNAILREAKKAATVLEAEASTDKEYKEFQDAVKAHEQAAIKLKALVDIYGKNVEVLSREATIRQNEYERSR
jgi:hypothetical protein